MRSWRQPKRFDDLLIMQNKNKACYGSEDEKEFFCHHCSYEEMCILYTGIHRTSYTRSCTRSCTLSCPRLCFNQLRKIRTICQSLSDNAIRTLIHSFVVTRIDYCNSVLSGITAVHTERVKRIMNVADSLVLWIPKFALVSTLIRDNLHWLPAVQWIKFKILQLVANCIHQRALLYIQEFCVLVSAVQGGPHLRSTDQFCLVVNRCRLSSMQRRGFAVEGSLAWNDLPEDLCRQCELYNYNYYYCGCTCLNSQEH